MSFVSEHYSTVFQTLVVDIQSRSGETTPKTELQADTAGSADSSEISSRLAKRAFDLSTQLLAAPNSTQQAGERSFQSSNGGSENEDESDRIMQNSDHSHRQPGAFARSVSCPTLDSAISDLQLVGLFAKNQDIALMSQQGQQDAQVVLVSSVAAIHAHTISRLLESTLPLSVDMEYWNAQGSSTLSVALYFIQSLPRRMYLWFVQTISNLHHQPSNGGRDLPTQLYLAMPKTLLFPDIGATTTGYRSFRRKRARLALFRIPAKVNIMSLTRREIRSNQAQIAEFQERLAINIGMLSQVSFNSTNMNAPNARRKTKPEALLQQVDTIVSELNVDDNVAGLLDCSDLARMVQAAESLALQVHSIPSFVERCIQNHRRPSLLSRCWLSATLAILGAKYLSSYIYGHQQDLKEWMSSGLVTLRNYVIQYILQPLRSGYETIRYGKHTYNVVTQESLKSDFKSLENMVLTFAGHFGTVDPAVVKKRVESGDLSDVMQVYAQEMQNPFRNALFGDLVQAILIQIQKVKVDVGQTMAALDKLLKSNELNFLLLSTVPATLTIYAAANWISGSLSWLIGGKKRNTITSIQLVVRDIDRLLNNSATWPQNQPASGAATASAASHGQLDWMLEQQDNRRNKYTGAITVGKLLKVQFLASIPKTALIAVLLIAFICSYLASLQGGTLIYINEHLGIIGADLLVSVSSLTVVTMLLYASRMRSGTRRGTLILIVCTFAALYMYDHGERFDEHGFYNLLVFMAIYIPLNIALATFYMLWCNWVGRNIPFVDLLPAGAQNFWAGSRYCKPEPHHINATIDRQGALHISCSDSKSDIFVEILPDTRQWPLWRKDMWNVYNTEILNAIIRIPYISAQPVVLNETTQAVVVRCGSSSTIVTRVSPSIDKLPLYTPPNESDTRKNIPAHKSATDWVDASDVITQNQFKRPNVIFLMLDAVSRRQFYRRLPKSANVLKMLHRPGANRLSELYRYHSTGFSTDNNTRAMYLGEIFPSKPNPLPIWAYYRDRGYVTARIETGCDDWAKAYVESYYTSQKYSVGNRSLDYELSSPFCMPEFYPRTGNAFGNFKGPYSIIARCLYGRYVHDWAFDYLYQLRSELRNQKDKSQQRSGPDRPYMITATFLEGHEGTGEVLRTVDDALAAFLEDIRDSGELEDTVLILGADHGLHMGINFAFLQNGRIEHQNPFFMMSVPEQLHQFAENYQQLYGTEKTSPFTANEQRLTTPFETYHTFRALADWPKVNASNWNRSLFAVQKAGRTCEDAGIGANFCICKT
ncbi:hypothetical protein IW138_003106 [Coemansia sp. RSA 986]|nr:hypothetical protein IW138_003106 [Coemansia sp. RSA 986]